MRNSNSIGSDSAGVNMNMTSTLTGVLARIEAATNYVNTITRMLTLKNEQLLYTNKPNLTSPCDPVNEKVQPMLPSIEGQLDRLEDAIAALQYQLDITITI